MKRREKLELKGKLELAVKSPDGKAVLTREVRNTVTGAGKTAIAKLIVGQRTTPFLYVAVGSGTPSESGLGNELGRAEASVSVIGASSASHSAQAIWTASFTPSSQWSVTEAGIFDADSDGTMLAYQSFSAVSVPAGFTLEVRWTLSLG